MTRTLAGLPVIAHGPSLYEHRLGSDSVWIGYDGHQWRVAVRSAPWAPRPFRTSQEAAELIRGAIRGAPS